MQLEDDLVKHDETMWNKIPFTLKDTLYQRIDTLEVFNGQIINRSLLGLNLFLFKPEGSQDISINCLFLKTKELQMVGREDKEEEQ